MPDDNKKDKKEKKERGKPPLLTMVLVIAVLFLAAGYAYYFFVDRPSVRTRAAQAQEQVVVAPSLLALDSITVNLADPGFRRYLRVRIALEYLDKRLEKELKEKGYRIQDAIISVLRAKRTDDLQDEKALRKELTQAVNAIVAPLQLSGLYFQELVIQ